ncbi:hypothetical protein [Desulfovibrio ferrophilus]|uniref:Uncharacterized protein n=1 Tax=Desulfovibrio ferrophilus TaxID=241368 RepID=A0A2Z6AZT9_9BACT|nr:hypothetical protein [Desulfovibrio ferrophilus]BBD08754.1 uncharacterized protein DFE_2028 [Desulfovibrio ferrophilus]
MAASMMSEPELAGHIQKALSSPSGKVLMEFLRSHCFMQPTPRPREWTGHEQVEFRYGRMTLFQLLDYFANPANFNHPED